MKWNKNTHSVTTKRQDLLMAHCVPMFEFTSHSQRNKVKLLTPSTPLHHCGNCSSRTCCSGSPMAHNGAQTHQVVSLCQYFLTLPVTSWGDTSLCIVDAKIRVGGGGVHSFHITGLLGDYTKLCACICWKICLCKQDDKTQPDVCNKQLWSSTLGAALVISVTGAL